MPRTRKHFPEVAAWLPQVTEPAVGHLFRFVRALVAAPRRGFLEPWASAVPAAVDGHACLLTAGHSLTRLVDRQLLLELTDRFQPLDLSPARVHYARDLDVATIVLPDSAFGWRIEWLDLREQLEPTLTAEEVEFFVAVGFPIREASVEPNASLLASSPRRIVRSTHRSLTGLSASRGVPTF